MFDFENYLRQELNNDKIVVLSEQLFAKNEEFEPDKIYVITKYLTSSIEYGSETQPVQILVLSEQNSLEKAKEIFDSFTVTHNWLAKMFENTFVKQQYSSPVVMSNFNEASYGYRSVLYVSATLYIMDNLSDVENLKINGVSIKPLNFTWSYQMTGNTQAIGGNKIASTVKNISTFQCSFSIPPLTTYISEDGFPEDEVEGGEYQDESGQAGIGQFTVELKEGYKIVAEAIEHGSVTNINQETGVISFISDGSALIEYSYISNNLLGFMLKVAAGQVSGNVDFNVSFTVYNTDFDFDCKLVSAQMATLPNDVPALQVGLQR